MSKRLSYSAMIAVSALLAGPVLAQTMSSPTASATNSATAVTSPAPTPANPASAPANSNTYVTADQQVRASKVIGGDVYNDQKEKIGTVNELLVGQNNNVTDAVLSVGGFLGIGSKLVKVPYNELHVAGNEVVLSGASKAQLEQMPSYRFSNPS
jgi:sporulation protein YlmC with PRC-barrel domain